jgi:hypothetical protein
MFKVAKYMVVTSNPLKNFLDEVERYIGDGWQPIGGISTQQIQELHQTGIPISGIAFYQAMVKYDKG